MYANAYCTNLFSATVVPLRHLHCIGAIDFMYSENKEVKVVQLLSLIVTEKLQALFTPVAL